MAQTSVDEVFRDFNTPGNPGSGDYQPEKPRIRALLKQIQNSGGQSVTRNTYAALSGVTPPTENYMGVVLNDPDPTKNGYYSRVANAWVWERGFPDSFTVFEQTGGTANALQLTSEAGVNPGDIVAGLLVPNASNTGATTIAINGDTAVPLLSAAGSPLAAGELVAGKATIIAKIGDGWRVILAFSQFSFRKAWDSATTYVADDIVESGGSLWLALTSNTNVTPTEGADWTLFLPGVTVGDGSVTREKLAPAVADQIYKTRASEDIVLIIDPVSGDENGTGSDSAPFKTINRAIAALPALMDKFTASINLKNGTHSESYVPAGDMPRAAIGYMDGRVRGGKRSDLPGGVAEGGLIIRGESETDTIIQFGGDFPYGFYGTSADDSIVFEDLRFLGLTGAQAAVTGHRERYLHMTRVTIDGDGKSVYGFIAEAGGKIEAVDCTVFDCSINGNVYDAGSMLQVSHCDIGAASTYGLLGGGGLLSIFGSTSVSAKTFATSGTHLQITGSGSLRPQISGIVETRASVLAATLADLSNAIFMSGGDADLSAINWSSQITQNGGHIRMAGCKSYIGPATQSLASVPWAIVGDGSFQIDATTEIIDSSGAVASPSYVPQNVSLTGNNQAVPLTLVGRLTNMKLSGGAANRTGCYLGALASRFAGSQPMHGGMLAIDAAGAAVELVDHSAPLGSAFPGGALTIGAGTGFLSGAIFAYNKTLGNWREVARSAVY